MPEQDPWRVRMTGLAAVAAALLLPCLTFGAYLL